MSKKKKNATMISAMNFAGSSYGIMVGAHATTIIPGADGERIGINANRETLIIVEYSGDNDGSAHVGVVAPDGRKAPVDEISVSVSSEQPVAYISSRLLPNQYLHGGDYHFDVVGSKDASVRVTAIRLS
jgi:hypothetical protein